MEDIRRTTNTTDQGIQRNQAYVTSSQGNMQRGKSVEEKETYFQPFSQMMVASNTSPRTTIDQRVTIEPSKKTSIIKINRSTEDLDSTKAHRIILKQVCEIENANFHEDNALFPCRFVTHKIRLLMKQLRYEDNNCRLFIIQQIGPYYLKYLVPALDHLKYQFTAGYSWKYCKDLNILANYFDFHPKDSPCLQANRTTIVKLYKQAIKAECNYVEYMENNPILNNSRNILKVLKTICSVQSTTFQHNFITTRDLEKYLAYRKKKQSRASSSSDTKTDDEITKQIDYLNSQQSYGRPIKSINKRVYYYLLSDKLLIISKKNIAMNAMDFNGRACTLEALTNICYQYSNLINELPCLAKDIARVSQSISLITLLAIEKTKGEGNIDPLKEKILNYILILGKKNHLNKECENIYFRCRQSQAVMITDNSTEYQCRMRFRGIFKILKSQLPKKFLTSASILKEFLDEKGEGMRQMATAQSTIRELKMLKRELYSGLFQTIFHSYNECKEKKMDDYQKTQALSIHKNQFIESNPYQFVLKTEAFQNDWRRIGCFILYNDIFALFNKTKIYEEDTETLLLLKDINEKLTIHFIREPVENALLKCLQSIIDNADLISIKTANALSSWVDILDRTFSIDPNLSSINDEWKNKIRHPETSMAIPNRCLTSETHNKYKLANPTQSPHCPPFAQSTYGNEFPIPPTPMMPCLSAQHPVQASYQPPKTQQHPLFQPTTMHHAEDRQENPLSLAIQQIRMSPLEPSMRLELLEFEEFDDTPMPIRNIHLQSHPEYPYLPSPLSTHFPNILPPPPLYQDTSRQQSSCQQQVALCRAMPHQYHPMDSPNFSER